ATMSSLDLQPKLLIAKVSPAVYSAWMTRNFNTFTHLESRKRKASTDQEEKKKRTRKEDYGTYDPDTVLPEKEELKRFHEQDKRCFWFFILSLLMNEEYKEVIAWTGRGREFWIRSSEGLIAIWSDVQKLDFKVQWDSVRRNLRSCYKKRIMMPVDPRHNRFAFITEPSVHIEGWTRGDLDNFIILHHVSASMSHIDESRPPSFPPILSLPPVYPAIVPFPSPGIRKKNNSAEPAEVAPNPLTPFPSLPTNDYLLSNHLLPPTPIDTPPLEEAEIAPSISLSPSQMALAWQYQQPEMMVPRAPLKSFMIKDILGLDE
ncbi:hypothetical protein PFISCL1PPCAC_7172, partial [Pristionchus fissidentatus]